MSEDRVLGPARAQRGSPLGHTLVTLSIAFAIALPSFVIAVLVARRETDAPSPWWTIAPALTLASSVFLGANLRAPMATLWRTALRTLAQGLILLSFPVVMVLSAALSAPHGLNGLLLLGPPLVGSVTVLGLGLLLLFLAGALR